MDDNDLALIINNWVINLHAASRYSNLLQTTRGMRVTYQGEIAGLSEESVAQQPDVLFCVLGKLKRLRRSF